MKILNKITNDINTNHGLQDSIIGVVIWIFEVVIILMATILITWLFIRYDAIKNDTLKKRHSYTDQRAHPN